MKKSEIIDGLKTFLRKVPPAAWIAAAGTLLVALSLIWNMVGDGVLPAGRRVAFLTESRDFLQGTWYPGTKDAGVILLEGLGADQTSLRAAAVEFARSGVHVFTFDFSGQGISDDAMPEDAALTYRLARQALAAKEVFLDLSGLDARQVILVGHSLGARVALQAATLDSAPPAGVVLIGPEINLSGDGQTAFLGSADDSTLDWVKRLGPNNPPVNILVMTGEKDAVFSPADAQALFERLTAGVQPDAVHGTTGALLDYNGRKVTILPGLSNRFEMTSAQALSAARAWAGEVWGIPSQIGAQAPTAQRRAWMWALGFAGVLVMLYGVRLLTAKRFAAAADGMGVQVTHPNLFLAVRLLMWVPAGLLAALLVWLAGLLPMNKPLENLIYAGILGGYGIAALVLYGIGKMPGTEGRLKFGFSLGNASRKQLGALAIFNIVLIVIMVLFARTGWFETPLTRERFLWMLIFLPFMALGFWAWQYESGLAEKAEGARWFNGLLVSLANLLPFFLLAVGLIQNPSSAMFGNLQGLLVLWVVALQGEISYRLSGLRWPGALFQAVLLCSLILPVGALFF